MKYPYKILTQLYSHYEIMFNHADFSTWQMGNGMTLVCDDWNMDKDEPVYNDYSEKMQEGSWFVKLIFESLDDIEIYEE